MILSWQSATAVSPHTTKDMPLLPAPTMTSIHDLTLHQQVRGLTLEARRSAGPPVRLMRIRWTRAVNPQNHLLTDSAQIFGI